MRFEFEQAIEAPLPRVVRAHSSTEFYEALGQMPNIGVREVLDRQEVDGAVVVKVRFAFTGSVSSAVRAVVDPAKLTWVMVTTIHPTEHRAEFEMLPDHYADRLQCAGGYQLAALGAATRQTVRGDLVVRVPFVGRQAERAILSGFRQHVAGEAALLADWAG